MSKKKNLYCEKIYAESREKVGSKFITIWEIPWIIDEFSITKENKCRIANLLGQKLSIISRMIDIPCFVINNPASDYPSQFIKLYSKQSIKLFKEMLDKSPSMLSKYRQKIKVYTDKDERLEKEADWLAQELARISVLVETIKDICKDIRAPWDPETKNDWREAARGAVSNETSNGGQKSI